MGNYYDTATEGEYHGVHLRARATIQNCNISWFQGDGIAITASAGAEGQEGNANNCFVSGCRILRCRNGMYFDGADANAGNIVGVDTSSNRQWGFWDSSFLGNTYTGCHADANGLALGGDPSVVSYNSNRYCVVAGQEATASTTAPSGTTADTAYWYYLGAGAASLGNNIPDWSNGMDLRAGGAYRTDDPNAATSLFGCYSEGGQGCTQVSTATTIFGGTHGAGHRGGAGVGASGSKFTSLSPIGALNRDGTQSTYLYATGDQVFDTTHTTYGPNTWKWSWGQSSAGPDLWFGYQNAFYPERITGTSTVEEFGTGTAQPYIRHIMNFALGAYGSARKQDYAAAARPRERTAGARSSGTTPRQPAAHLAGHASLRERPGTWKAISGIAA
jgi:hypothetical protein